MQDHALSAIAYFGSSIACAFLSAVVASPTSRGEPQYAYVQVGAQRCLADTSSDALVTIDAVPECLPGAGRAEGAVR
jgi:hypothetical protein